MFDNRRRFLSYFYRAAFLSSLIIAIQVQILNKQQ